MRMIFVGTGSAFCLKNYQSNFLIESNGKNLLVDAGGDIRFALRDVNLSYKDIDALYVTHPHNDHIGGMEYLALTSYFDPEVKDRIKYFGHRGLTNEVWNAISPGLATIQGVQASFGTFFDAEIVEDNDGFQWESIKFDIVQSVHIINKYSIMPSFGFMITLKMALRYILQQILSLLRTS